MQSVNVYSVDNNKNVIKDGVVAMCPFQTRLLGQSLDLKNKPLNGPCNLNCPKANLATHVQDEKNSDDVYPTGAYLEISCAGTVGYYKVGEIEQKEVDSEQKPNPLKKA